ncbi:c-type cytochrome [Chondromyces crocatus]|uniref:Uncharacterized protein n=1 Tax=Chondromyces crocatus TaxID=52 RepID=A0A0K1EAI5_CHOCO|nr:c-type cytochrome [Chondromyces crocatus]AKT37896.1 uncharacterized protein CMC5_020390 [Chondromyces crocatus]
MALAEAGAKIRRILGVEVRRYSSAAMKAIHPWGGLVVSALCAALFVACGDGDGPEEQPPPVFSSGSTCPPDSTLTWESFGQGFMETYCMSCHSSSLSGSARKGAPVEHDYDTLEASREAGAEHIDRTTAAGPARVNRRMPPVYPEPSEDERRMLGEWLACGMP